MSMELRRLWAAGWGPTIRADELIKVYDGFVGVIHVLPPGAATEVRWAVWFTGSAPLASGFGTSLARAADSADRAVRKLQRNDRFTTPGYAGKVAS